MSRLSWIGWHRWAAELLVIVVGVLVALGVDDWREAKRERALEHYVLTRLEEDLDRDLVEIETTLASAYVRMGAVTSILRAVDHEYAEASSLDGVEVPPLDGLTIFRARAARIFDHQDGAFRELLSTGSIQVLSDLRLRSDIANYYGLVEGIIEVNGMIRAAEGNLVRALAEAGIATADSQFRGVDARAALRGQESILAELREVRHIARVTVSVITPTLERARELKASLGGAS